MDLLIYKGNSRANLSELIESNWTVAIGAPVSIPVDDGAVIIALVKPITPA